MTRTFFIADWNREGGVYALDFDFDSGKITAVDKAAEGHNTSFFASSAFERQKDPVFCKLRNRRSCVPFGESGAIREDHKLYSLRRQQRKPFPPGGIARTHDVYGSFGKVRILLRSRDG